MSSFEKALVYHCSPTLCGLKPANLLSLSKDEYPHLPQLAAAYARLLEDKGIRIYRTFVGEFATSMEMAGASISIMKLDDETRAMLDMPVATPFYCQK